MMKQGKEGWDQTREWGQDQEQLRDAQLLYKGCTLVTDSTVPVNAKLVGACACLMSCRPH